MKHPVPSPQGRTTLPIGRITLDAYEVVIVLSDVIDSVTKLAQSIEITVANAHKDLQPGGSDVVVAFDIGWEADDR